MQASSENPGSRAIEDAEKFRGIVANLPAALYSTDADGRITYFNQAAADLWGRSPVIGEDFWCGSWRLYWPDGTPMPHEECPMAVTVKTGKPIRGAEAIAERPDGSRFPFTPFPTPMFDGGGKLTGAVNMLVEISGRKQAEQAVQHLAAIVAASDDAIIGATLAGVITAWNEAAERLFGYRAEEIVGQPLTTLIPEIRHADDKGIIARVAAGEHIDHYETIRLHKDGGLVDVQLTVSPIRQADGCITGISKIARDITGRKRAELLLQRDARRIARSSRVATNISLNFATASLFDQTSRLVHRQEGEAGPIRWAIMRYLSRSRKPRQEADIANYLGVAMSSIARDVSLLARHGFIVRTADPASGVERFALSDNGRAALQLDPLRRLAKAIAQLSEDRREAFAESLETVADQLSRDDLA